MLVIYQYSCCKTNYTPELEIHSYFFLSVFSKFYKHFGQFLKFLGFSYSFPNALENFKLRKIHTDL